jgi:hypothetical protein
MFTDKMFKKTKGIMYVNGQKVYETIRTRKKGPM